MSEMVGRVAKAQNEAAIAWEQDKTGTIPFQIFVARAAIAAIREPTGEMISAMCRCVDEGDAIKLLADQWRAGIDEALK